jgi:hypothetical protein
MQLQQDLGFSFGFSDVSVTLTFDQIDHITKNSLLQAMEQIEDLGGPEEISTYDAIVETLAYFTSPSEREQLTTRVIHPRWLNIVAGKTDD